MVLLTFVDSFLQYNTVKERSSSKPQWNIVLLWMRHIKNDSYTSTQMHQNKTQMHCHTDICIDVLKETDPLKQQRKIDSIREYMDA